MNDNSDNITSNDGSGIFFFFGLALGIAGTLI